MQGSDRLLVAQQSVLLDHFLRIVANAEVLRLIGLVYVSHGDEWFDGIDGSRGVVFGFGGHCNRVASQ